MADSLRLIVMLPLYGKYRKRALFHLSLIRADYTAWSALSERLCLCFLSRKSSLNYHFSALAKTRLDILCVPPYISQLPQTMQLGKHDSEQVRQHGVRATQILPSHSISTPISQIPDRKARWRVFVHAGILIFTFEFTKSIRALPLVSQYQNDLCSSATEDTPCQSAPSIAGELEKVLAIFQVLDCLPVLLLSGFYGSMADRYGKGSILILSYLGVVLSSIWITGVSWLAPTVPLRLIWLGPLFSTIGGGHSMPISLLMTSIADVVPRAQRAATYSFVYGAAMVATTLGTKSALAMLPSTGTFAPLLIGLDLMWLILALSVCMPNTRRENAPVALVPDWYSAVDGTLDHLSPTICKQQARGCKSVIQAAFDSNHALWHTQGAFSILLAGFISALGQQLQVLVLQYMPERFSVDSTDVRNTQILTGSS